MNVSTEMTELPMTSEAVTGDDLVMETTTVQEDFPGFDYEGFSAKMFIILDPIILLVGLVGNSLLIAVMQRKALKSSSTSVYMTALAVADINVLVLDFINNWFKLELDIYVLGSTNGFCKFYRFFFNFGYTYSGWLIVALAAEKFIAVWLPFQAKTLCTRRNAIITVLVLPVPIFALYLYNLWAWQLDDQGYCEMVPDWVSFQSNIGPWLSAAVYSYVPITILIGLNSAIIYKLWSMKAQWQAMGGQDKSSAKEKAERKVTITVVTVCVFYIVLTFPIAVFYIVMFAEYQFVNPGPEIALVENIILLFGLSNHSINFFLYVMTSGRFRNELMVMFGRPIKTRRSGTSSDTGSKGRMSKSVTGSTMVGGDSPTVQPNDVSVQI